MTLLLGTLFCFAPATGIFLTTAGGWKWLMSTLPRETQKA